MTCDWFSWMMKSSLVSIPSWDKNWNTGRGTRPSFCAIVPCPMIFCSPLLFPDVVVPRSMWKIPSPRFRNVNPGARDPWRCCKLRNGWGKSRVRLVGSQGAKPGSYLEGIRTEDYRGRSYYIIASRVRKSRTRFRWTDFSRQDFFVLGVFWWLPVRSAFAFSMNPFESITQLLNWVFSLMCCV